MAKKKPKELVELDIGGSIRLDPKIIKAIDEKAKKRNISRDDMVLEIIYGGLNRIFYKKDGTNRSTKEIDDILMLGTNQMIFLDIQPAFEHTSPAVLHVKDIGEEREFHCIVQRYYIPDEHNKWILGDTLEIIIIKRDPISDNHNNWIEIDGEIRNITLEERKKQRQNKFIPNDKTGGEKENE